jgi:hypothetical protein
MCKDMSTVTILPIKQYAHVLGLMTILSRASLTESMQAIMRKLHANLVFGGIFNDSLDE